MPASKWISAILMVCALTHPTYSLAQDTSEVLGEGFDKQSDEEIEKARLEIEHLFKDAIEPKSLSIHERQTILAKYSHLDPGREVPNNLLAEAVLYFDKNMSRFSNRSHISVIDFRPRSDQQRFFVIDMNSGRVTKYRTTHGVGSDKDKNGYAERFGNVPNSGASSLGFIRTAEVYSGKFKRSVRLDGLSSTNSNVRKRAIVLHGWDKAHEKPVIQGLSWGCPALDWDVKDSVIDRLKEGSLMYIGVAK